MSSRPELLLVYEPVAACRARLIVEGRDAEAAGEIASYLDQSTDLALEFGEISAACANRGVDFVPVQLDDAAITLRERNRETTLVWTLTDGIAYFRGGAAPAFARLGGFRTIGANDALFALCQDKFRSGAVLRALGLPAPQTGLCRNGDWIARPPQADSYFVKPNRLGSKVGIWSDSHCYTLGEAERLSRRIFERYGDDAAVQPYVAGRNVRASFLGLEPDTGVDRLGVFFVDSDGDFQTMMDSLALYGDTGAAANAAGHSLQPTLVAVRDTQPHADIRIRALAQTLITGLGLRDVYSIDLRVEPNGTIHLIEFEVCPGLPCFDFRAYCRSEWDATLAQAMAATAAARLI